MRKPPEPDQIPECKKCGKPHITRFGGQACGAHLQSGKPCPNPPNRHLTVCRMHGADARHLKEIAARRELEAKVRKLLPDTFEPHPDVIGEALRLASEAAAFRDALRSRVDLDQLSTRNEYTGEQVRAEVQLYERALDRLGKLLIDLHRAGMMEVAARRQDEAYRAEIRAEVEAQFAAQVAPLLRGAVEGRWGRDSAEAVMAEVSAGLTRLATVSPSGRRSIRGKETA